MAAKARAQLSQNGELLLYGEIGDWTAGMDAESIVRDLEAASGDVMNVRIHSGGGNIMEGLAIYNRLKQSGKQVHVHIDGMAASMASVIAMSGDVVHMPSNAWLMLHKPWLGGGGNSKDLRKNADTLDGFEASLIAIYKAKTGQSEKALAAMLDAETWLNAKDAKRLGFIDVIVEEVKAAASINLERFTNTPTQLTQVLNMTVKVKVKDDIENMTEAEAKAEARNARAESTRRTEIQALSKYLPSAAVAKLIEDGTSIEKARNAALEAMAAKDAAHRPDSSRSSNNVHESPQTRFKAYAEALACRHSNQKPSEFARQFMGKGLPEMARDVLESIGVNTSYESPHSVVAKAMHTTSDFPTLLADSAERMLRSAYSNIPATMRQIARQNTARDFRPLTRVQLSEAPTLERITEGAEYKHGTMSESKETYSLGTYGKLFGLSRQAIINDDLGAFSDLNGQLGRAVSEFEAGFLLEKITSNPKMGDDKALFHATHGNLGSAGALSETTLTEARTKLRMQKGLDGKTPIDARPRYLVVPASLETTAEKLLTAIQANRTDDVNVFANLMLLVEPRLDAVSATAWYLFSDPGLLPTLEYSYLEGANGPSVETRQGWDTDGVEFKVRLDIGAGLLDWRGAFLNAGA